ncbi:hypothetical protein Esti_006420 [Eimeria stiedai]
MSGFPVTSDGLHFDDDFIHRQRLPCGSALCLDGIPSRCSYTPFWDASFRSGALLGSGSSSGCSLIYRGRGPEPSSLLSCYLGGFRLDDRALPLGRICKNVANPLLEVEVVNAIGVCYFHQLLSDHPLAVCTQPSCCCCCAKLPSDPDPYGLRSESKKAVAAVAAARGRRVTVLEELLPYQAVHEEKQQPGCTPVLVLPCGVAHSAIELVAVKHSLDDVVFSNQLGRHPFPECASEGKRGEACEKARKGRGDSSCNDGYPTSEADSSADSEPESLFLSDWEASLHAAGCSLGLEGRRLAELHPQTFQWTREGGPRLRSEGAAYCKRHVSSGGCCSNCCWCPMVAEVDSTGTVRNIFERGEAKHAPHPLDTIKAKESVVSERLLEIKTDDKHPYLKLIFARNSRGFYVARLNHTEEALSADEAVEALQQAAHGRAAADAWKGAIAKGFCCGGLSRQLEVQVLHDAPYGYRVPRQEGGLSRYKDKEAGTLHFKVPKRLPAHPTVINVAVSPFTVGEAALLYSSQLVSLWKAEEARMEVQVPVSLSVATRSIRRAARPSLRYRQRALAADPSTELFQTLSYTPHQREMLLLGSDNLWTLDLRAKAMTRLFPALHAPTHGSTLQCVAETFYAPCTTNSSYHTAFTALAPHPTQPFLLAAAHDATESVYLFDLRAMHEPLTVVGLPTVRKTGARYRSLLWHSSRDKWAEAHRFEAMRAASFYGRRARAAAVATAGSPAGGDSSTHDLLAAFSWRSEDVVCSAFRVHPAFCPKDSSVSSGAMHARSSEQEIHVGKSRGISTEWKQEGVQERPRFQPSPMQVVQKGCLPTIIDREVVEVSWQAEVSMFPRVSWGLENRERCYPIPSRTPVGSAWTPQPPFHVTVDEHAATGTFHGFAGACLFDLPVTPTVSNALFHEGSTPPPRRRRCSICGARSPRSLPSSESPAPDIVFCGKCSSPIGGLGVRVREASGSVAVLGAFTTSGRLMCRALTLNDPVLQLRLQRRKRLYGGLVRRQRLFQIQGGASDTMHLDSELAATSGVSGAPEAVASLIPFHSPQLNHSKDSSSSMMQQQQPRAKSTGAHQPIAMLLSYLKGSYNESRILPQRAPILLLQAQLQQSLQRELLFRAAVRWMRGQQLQLLRRAQLEGHLGSSCGVEAAGIQLLSFLRESFAAQKLSVQWPRKLLSFDFCDSGALRVHQPAFLIESYDPEPIVQTLLTDSGFDEHLNCPEPSSSEMANEGALGAADETQGCVGGRRERHPMLASSSASSEEAQPPQGGPSCSISESSNFASSQPESGECQQDCREHEQHNQCASQPPGACEALKELLEVRPRDPDYTAVAEVSALPFPTARSRAVFRYAVEAVEALSHATSEKSVLQLRYEDIVLLHDVLLAIHLWRQGFLTEAQTVSLLGPFTSSRPCSPSLLDMQRTTLDLGLPAPRSPQEALEAAIAVPRAQTCSHSSTSCVAGGEGARETAKGSQTGNMAHDHLRNNTEDVHSSTRGNAAAGFRKVANPALAPITTCCCRVMLEHHCDVHACAQISEPVDLTDAAHAGWPETHYAQTDGLHALLQVLRTESKSWLDKHARRDGVQPLRDFHFLPQALVDELAETLFLTHEVLLVPQRECDCCGIPNARGLESELGEDEANSCLNLAVSIAKGALGALANDKRRLLGGLELHHFKRELPHSEGDADHAGGRQLADTECPLSSPWLPAYCLSRHLHAFIRTDKLLADDDHVQVELQRQAWPELLLQQQRRQAREASQRTKGAQQYSRFPANPPLNLPQSMQCQLPDHVLEALACSKWKRLLSGIAVNNVIIADLLLHWGRVPALQRLREARDEHREAPAGPHAEEAAAAFTSDGTAHAPGVPAHQPSAVERELSRLLGATLSPCSSRLAPKASDAAPPLSHNSRAPQSHRSFSSVAVNEARDGVVQPLDKPVTGEIPECSLPAPNEKTEEAAAEEAAVDGIGAGDLSDCPPPLREFVFTSPHPFPFTVDPEALEASQVKAAINLLLEKRQSQLATSAEVYAEETRWCAAEGLHTDADEAKWLQYPEPNVLWPNPLLHNHRLQPFTWTNPASPERAGQPPTAASETDTSLGSAAGAASREAAEMEKVQLRLNRLRLEQLWKHSGVHGVSWDEIDELFIKYKQQQQERQQRWESRKQQLLEYAGLVCARRLRMQRLEFVKSAGVELETLDEETKEQLLVPRSLFRRLTRRLFYKWHDEYFAPWRPGGLQSVLKAFVTLRMLQRETNERFLHLPFPPQPVRGSGEGKPNTPVAAAGSQDRPAPAEAGANLSLEEKLQYILKRPYAQRSVGSWESAQKPAGASQKVNRKTPEEENAAAATEADGRTWDFAGLGSRVSSRRTRAPEATKRDANER